MYSYGKDIASFYGDKGAIDLGTIGNAGMVSDQGITDVDTMRQQVAAAKAAGVTKIHAYSLDGILSLKAQDPSVSETEWLDIFQAEAAVPPTQPAVTVFRLVLAAIEALSKLR